MTKQDQEELWIFKTFARLIPGGPITVFKKHEAPDFIIEFEGKTIGVELTEVFQDSSAGHSKLQQRSSEWENFTDLFIQKIQPLVNFTFAVGIDFSVFIPIRKVERILLIERLIEICTPKLQVLDHHQHLEFDYYDGLPEQIDTVRFSRFDGLKESFDFRPEGGPVDSLTTKHLLPLLAKKEGKLKKYTGCEEYWLLIREGNYYAGSFSDEELDISIETTFDKVFLLRTKQNQLISLK